MKKHLIKLGVESGQRAFYRFCKNGTKRIFQEKLENLPFLILMIIVIPLSRLIVGTSIGTVASIVPLVIASFPFVSRLIETSIREVDPGVIEAAQSMGATPLQIITKVMVPESMPSLVANITIAATTIMGYGAMAGIIGGGGLGKIAIDYGYYRHDAAGGAGANLADRRHQAGHQMR